MCGRYTIVHSHKELIERFRVTKELLESGERFNVAPTQTVPIVIHDGVSAGRALMPAKWGLVPTWAFKVPKPPQPMINARAETILEKKTFKGPMGKSRCLIPADGFFEWQGDKANRKPVYIRLKSKELFSFAGLFQKSKDKEGNEIDTCTIITTSPNELMQDIHHRMPVILSEGDEEAWLDSDAVDEAQALKLLNPYDSSRMEAFPVSKLVNSVKNKGPELIEPLTEDST